MEPPRKVGLFQKPCEFVLSCVRLEDLPESSLPEVAFVGRSNVGKSSLINALVGNGHLARTSNTPGRTQALNFFCLAQAIYLVDLPGYGYALAPKKSVASWQKLMKRYLMGRPQLARVFVLIDSRHSIKPIDEDMFRLLDDAAVSYQVILTKTDKLSASLKGSLVERVSQICSKFKAAHPVVLLSSSHSKEGLEEIRTAAAYFAQASIADSYI